MVVVAARTWDMVHDPVLENSQTHDVDYFEPYVWKYTVEILAIFSGYRWSGDKHGDCWDSQRTSTAHCQGRQEGMQFWWLINKSRGRGREGIGVRPVVPLEVEGLAPVSSKATGRLAGARPNAVVAIRVAASTV